MMVLRPTMNILHGRFDGMVISHRGKVNWPSRSNDLTALHFFFWGFLQSQVYANKPQTIDALKGKKTNAVAQIQPNLWCNRVIENWTTTSMDPCHREKPWWTFKILSSIHNSIACFIPYQHWPAVIEKPFTIDDPKNWIEIKQFAN